MKRFQIIQKNFARLGISSSQSRWNRQSAITFSFYTLAVTCGGLFLFFSANTFLEYLMDIFVTITMFAVLIGFLFILFQKKQLFDLIDALEGFFDESVF